MTAKKKKIATIIGARPQFIKAAPFSRAINEHNRRHAALHIEEALIHTGQHYDDSMSAVFFRELGIAKPLYELNIGSSNHGKQTGLMLIAIEDALIKEKPDWVLVYGDTNSTLAGALAAAKLNIPVIHMEAGLRSHNRTMPEEINRITVDHLSHLLLCPSQTAVDNLVKEGIEAGVVLSGDIMADALHFAAKQVGKTDVLNRYALIPKQYLLATIHRPGNTDNEISLKNIIAALARLEETVVLPLHPRTRKALRRIELQLPKNVLALNPVGYLDAIALMQSARLVLTDSGGMQKEAYWLEVPCVTLRDETEWPETVKTGWNTLVGNNSETIVNAVRSFSLPSAHPPLYGDGKAAECCLNAIIGYDRVPNHQEPLRV